jgi:hypothetical protein
MPLTPDERRERDRTYKRSYRAAQRAKSAAAAAATSDKSDKAKSSNASDPPLLEKTMREAVALMKQLTDSDNALVETLYATARNVDRLVATNDLMWTARINSGHQTITRILHELGGTPTARQQYEFRSKKLTPASTNPKAVPDADTNQGGATVTPITRRPEKRRRRVGK